MVAPQMLLTLGVASITFLTAEGSPTAPGCVETNLVQNPSFESTKFSPWINFHGGIDDSSYDIMAEDLNRYFIANLVTTDTFISVRQTVHDLTIGQSYALQFWYGLGTKQQLHGDICDLSVTIDGEVAGSAIRLLPTSAGRYQLAERVLVADETSKTLRFEFNCGGSIGEVDAILDNISLIARCP